MVGMIQYLIFTLLEGDYLNDFITHAPVILRPVLVTIGKFICGG